MSSQLKKTMDRGDYKMTVLNFAKVDYVLGEGFEVGKMFETYEEAVEFTGEKESVYPVVYPSVWAGGEVRKNYTVTTDTNILVELEGEQVERRCFILGIDCHNEEMKKNWN